MHLGSITALGTTHLRRCGMHFGIRQPDRLSHVYIVGKTGTGKSTLLSSMVLQDIGAERGTCLIDPHGDAVAAIAESRVARERSDVIYFDAADPACPFGYNPLRLVRRDRIPLAVSGMLEALQMLWPNAWGVRMEHLLRNALYALLETRGSTLADIIECCLTAPSGGGWLNRSPMSRWRDFGFGSSTASPWATAPTALRRYRTR